MVKFFDHDPRLPVTQLAILSVARFAEPIAFTSIYPYLPEMIQSLGIRENDVSIYVGWCSAVFSIAQCLSAILWARASDVFGRKYTVIVGLACAMVLMLLWGFSSSIAMALTVRAIQGFSNGNVGIIRTMVVEMCPWPDLHYRTFSIMPMVWNLGSIFGPMLGGLLANPYNVQPGKSHGNNLLELFPYALPNIVVSCVFLVGIVWGILFLEETMDGLKDQADRGLILGNKIKKLLSRRSFNPPDANKSREREPLLRKSQDAEAANPKASPIQAAPKSSGFLADASAALTTQTSLALAAYTILALYSLGYDNLMPVFLHRTHDNTKQSFFRFDTGFGLSTRRIGTITSVYGLSSLLVQTFIYPPVAKYFGGVNVYRVVHLVQALTILLTPFTVLLPDSNSRQFGVFFCMLVKSVCGVFAFPCAIILLTNNCPSKRVLGTLNGIAVSLSAIGRGLGPYIGGNLFSFGVENRFLLAPFLALSFMALLAMVTAIFIVSGAGLVDESRQSDISNEESAATESVVANGEPTAERVHVAALSPDGGLLHRRPSAVESLLSEEGQENVTAI